MSRVARIGLTASIVAIGALTPAAAARAGTYEVWTCRAPDGSPAPTAAAEGGGWAPRLMQTGLGGGNRAEDRCGTGGPLIGSLAETLSQPAPSWLFWEFHSPPSTSVVAYSLDYSGYSRAGLGGPLSVGDVSVLTSLQADPVYDARHLASGIVDRRSMTANSGGASTVRVVLGCVPPTLSSSGSCQPDVNGPVARVDVFRGVFTLLDRDTPDVTGASGDAVTNTTWAGPTGISFGATDQGGGVYRLAIEVDGRIENYVNLADAPCRSWPGSERTFLSPKPCPSTVGGLKTFDTKDLPEGVHAVRVLVEDAAGNQATVYGPTTKRLRRTDPGPNNGSPAVDDARLQVAWEGRESDLRSIRFDQQPIVKGQLTTAKGQPIRSAYVRTTITRDARNSPPFERTSLRTDEEGRFRWKLPRGISSRSLVFAYHQRVREDEPVAVRKLRLRVSAALRLRLSRRTARRGQSVRLTGSVVGRPLPAGGKVVELQARDPGGRWITFRTVRSGRGGRFATNYRFRKPGPARFQMRARARRSGDYPYATGSSPVRAIRVR